MNDKIRQKLIDTILDRIPTNIKPVDYLMEKLEIGRESVYRRLRGDMPFTFDEIILLSNELNFSLDTIINQKQKNFFNFISQPKGDPQHVFLSHLQLVGKILDKDMSYHPVEITTAVNYLPMPFAILSKEIFDFIYFMMCRDYNGLNRFFYSNVVVPPRIEALRTELNLRVPEIKNITWILDPNVFLSPLKELNYIYRLKLVNDEELDLLKSEFFRIIDLIEKMAITGGSEIEAKHTLYLSEINIEGTSSNIVCENDMTSYYMFPYITPIVTNDMKLCKIHRNWLNLLKKYSTQVTQSNEYAISDFFEKQREYVKRVELNPNALPIA